MATFTLSVAKYRILSTAASAYAQHSHAGLLYGHSRFAQLCGNSAVAAFGLCFVERLVCHAEHFCRSKLVAVSRGQTDAHRHVGLFLGAATYGALPFSASISPAHGEYGLLNHAPHPVKINKYFF